ncbi:MAG: hypothetical protein HPY66_1735 [Firmicutes bacterium]|nr:hypothetical protein [Bacillota bacterium]
MTRNEEYKQLLNWPANLTGRGVKVAILDQRPTSYHGSCVRQIIEYLAPEAEIHSINVREAGEDMLTSLEALQWCLDNDIQVVNISADWPHAETREVLFDQLAAQGCIIPCAAGNDSHDYVDHPAAYDSTIAVGAYKQGYSNWGKKLDVLTYTNWEVVYRNQKQTFPGTSGAAPVISSVAALWKQANPMGGTEGFRAFLGRNSEDLYESGKDVRSGYGLFCWKETLEVKSMFDTTNVSSWAIEAQDWAVTNGISDGTNPKGNVTREELWTMLYRFWKLLKEA